MVRAAREQDLPRILTIYNVARRYMRAHGNTAQWVNGYPSEELLRQVRQQEQFSVESIGDIAYLMERRTQLKRVHTVMLLAGLPMSLLEVTGVVLWIVTGVWWPCAVYLLLSVPFGILISRYYFRRVAYLCPQCHTVFRPALKEAFFARHTPSARKLMCGCCGYHGFCVETLGSLS